MVGWLRPAFCLGGLKSLRLAKAKHETEQPLVQILVLLARIGNDNFEG